MSWCFKIVQRAYHSVLEEVHTSDPALQKKEFFYYPLETEDPTDRQFSSLYGRVRCMGALLNYYFPRYLAVQTASSILLVKTLPKTCCTKGKKHDEAMHEVKRTFSLVTWSNHRVYLSSMILLIGGALIHPGMAILPKEDDAEKDEDIETGKNKLD